ncbi:hypothetical protein PRIPAC_92628 [Pristionchus pacificus]|uniref:Uncharacterized protein n=1 Tax=Pristionchus pacificus TaxID=54126 RepID=A0A2A6BIG4_PRIPA|nr:hypothetical protein PRIPAC_92628 [Pristionchus pacificus]|eukprot:PDM65679.1 hypothetical protein PRIPAC_45593 [Pristionchus pacificus]
MTGRRPIKGPRFAPSLIRLVSPPKRATPVLVARKPLRITISGRKFSGAGLAGILERKSYTKQLVPFIAPVPWSWIAPTPSQSTLKIVEMTTSEICAAEFADWTIFDADFGDDDLGECMRLYNVWLWCAEEDAPWDAWFSWKEAQYTERDMITAYGPKDDDLVTPVEANTSERRRFAQAWAPNDSSTSLSSLCSTWSCLTTNWVPFACRCDAELEEGMRLFAAWSTEAEAEDDEEEVLVEPESDAIPWTVALLPTKDLLPAPSAGLLRALSCPDALMYSLAALLFETRHFNVINPRSGPSVLNTGNWLNAGFLNPDSGLLALPAPALNAGSGLLALPAPPAWMLALEHDRETDAPNTVSTVSLASGWDVISARLSSSSIFNLFSTSASSASSLFADPTGVPSLDSTVAPWETPSTDSVTGCSFTSGASSAYPAGAPSLRSSPTRSLYTTSADESSVVSIPSRFFADTTGAPSPDCTTDADTESSSFSEHVCRTSCFDGTSSAASSEADVTESASTSSLFPDPRSAHSCNSRCFKVAPSTASASSIFPDPRSTHSCTSSCFELSSSSTTSASSTASSSAHVVCPDCGRCHNCEQDDESSASSASDATSSSSSSSSSNPYRHVRFGTSTLIPSTSATSSPSTTTSSSGYESDSEQASGTDFEGLTSEYEGDDVDGDRCAYVIIDPIESEPARDPPSHDCIASKETVEKEPAAVVVEPTVTTVSAATQTQAPDEEVCGLDAYLALFDEDTSRLLKKAFEEKRRKIRFLK